MHGSYLPSVALGHLSLPAILFMLSHEAYLYFHHRDNFVDLVKSVLGMSFVPIVKVGPPDVPQKVVTTELCLKRNGHCCFLGLEGVLFLPIHAGFEVSLH
jgi:hypothetical protein